MKKTKTSSYNQTNRQNNGQKRQKRLSTTNFLTCPSLTLVPDPPDNNGQESYFYQTPVATQLVKEIFLDRFQKEIVRKFRPNKKTKDNINMNTRRNHALINESLVLQKDTKESEAKPMVHIKSNKDDKNDDEIWKQRIVIGTNQCSRLLEACCKNQSNNKFFKESSHNNNNPIQLIVLAKDIYPPMFMHIPYLAYAFNIPVLLLPGRATIDLGRVLNMKRTSIIVFQSSNNDNYGVKNDPTTTDDDHHAIDSFIDFVIKEQIPGPIEKISSN